MDDVNRPEPAPLVNSKPAIWDLVVADVFEAWTNEASAVSDRIGGLAAAYRLAIVQIAMLRRLIDGKDSGYGHAYRHLVEKIPEIVEDMQARDRSGQEKYGTRLQPFNGRNQLVDAYQEALDCAVYLRAALFEKDGR